MSPLETLGWIAFAWLWATAAVAWLMHDHVEAAERDPGACLLVAACWPYWPVLALTDLVVAACGRLGRLWPWLVAALFNRLVELTVGARRPDFVIGEAGSPYLERWWLIPRNGLFNIYVHRILRSDDDRALHDHPWFNASLILAGRYVEHVIAAGGVARRTERAAGALKLRSPWAAHRLELIDGEACWTLFVTGPRLRAWGFHCPRGWVHWRAFTDPADKGRRGRGCGEVEA
ncbi:MAG TPA: hypothetical protein VL358_04700 [Caulobacteraceae bacterium]|nr:hypothetical protein [Caulobacteraceae bacterium]